MAQAAAEVSAFFQPYEGQFPPGSTATIPLSGSMLYPARWPNLLLGSPQRSNNELLDLANVYVRASFTSIPGFFSRSAFLEVTSAP